MTGAEDIDLIVVGAGAAGLAAAKTALRRGLSVTVLEAKDRIGGRAVTDTDSLGIAWDRGAHWLHQSDSNFFVSYARKAGFEIDPEPSSVFLHGEGGLLNPDVVAERDEYFDRAFDAIDTLGGTGRDVPASDAVPPHPRFRAMFDSWYAAVSGVEPDRTSALDHYRYRADDPNLRVRPGYGALVAHFGHGVPVRLSTPVERIQWNGPDAAVETADGVLNCRAVIVTASTSALAAGAIRFDPPLPPETEDAFHAVPLGEAEKIAFAFDSGVLDLPPNSHVAIEHQTMEAIRFHVRPFGTDVAIGTIAGRFAAELEAQGPAVMRDFAEEKLVQIFGADIRRKIKAAATTHWLSDPFIRGGYSCTLPGKANARKTLNRPVGERLFFAGEACSITAYGAVHGAYETGVAAADRVAAVLGREGR